jgi:hypothetical protein
MLTCLWPYLQRVQVCRQADGYQPSMVAPEKGLRQLSSEALDYVTEPVKSTTQEVYNLLINAARWVLSCSVWAYIPESAAGAAEQQRVSLLRTGEQSAVCTLRSGFAAVQPARPTCAPARSSPTVAAEKCKPVCSGRAAQQPAHSAAAPHTRSGPPASTRRPCARHRAARTASPPPPS